MKDAITAMTIISAAQNYFKRFGIRNTSINDLAAELGISKKTIYRYYAGKRNLVECVITKEIGQKMKAFQESRLMAANAVEQVFLASVIMRDCLKTMNSTVLYELRHYYPQSYKIVKKFTDEFLVDYVRANIEKGIEEALYRKQLKIEILSRYLIQIVLLPDLSHTPNRNRFSSGEMESQILSYHLHAIATDKGIQLIKKYQDQYMDSAGYYKNETNQ